MVVEPIKGENPRYFFPSGCSKKGEESHGSEERRPQRKGRQYQTLRIVRKCPPPPATSGHVGRRDECVIAVQYIKSTLFGSACIYRKTACFFCLLPVLRFRLTGALRGKNNNYAYPSPYEPTRRCLEVPTTPGYLYDPVQVVFSSWIPLVLCFFCTHPPPHFAISTKKSSKFHVVNPNNPLPLDQGWSGSQPQGLKRGLTPSCLAQRFAVEVSRRRGASRNPAGSPQSA